MTQDEINDNRYSLLDITLPNGNVYFGVISFVANSVVCFDYYLNGEFARLTVNYDDYDKYQISPTKDWSIMEGMFDKEAFMAQSILFNADNYNVKLLGISTLFDEDDDMEYSKRIYFAVHDKFVEITITNASVVNRSDNTIDKYIKCKESYNIEDFDLNPAYTYEIYSSNDSKKRIIEPKILTGERFVEFDEVKDCIDDFAEGEIEKEGRLNGLDFGGVAIIFEHDFFEEGEYNDYSMFDWIAYEDFVKRAFNYEVEKTFDDYER